MAAAQASLAFLPADWVIFGLFAIFLAVVNLRAGTRVSSALALALPVAVYVLTTLGSTAVLGGLVTQVSNDTGRIILFAAIFFMLYFLVFRMLGQFMWAGASPLKAIFAALAAGLVGVIFWLQVPALLSVWHPGTLFQTLFGASYRFWWLLLSYAILSIAR